MPPEVEGETPAACRQTLVELFQAPLMTKVRFRFVRAFCSALLCSTLLGAVMGRD